MEGGAILCHPLDTEKVVRKDWKVVAEEMAQATWAPEEVGSSTRETDGRETKVTKVQSWKSRSCLTVEAEKWKVRARFPREKRHQRESKRDDLGKNQSG